MLLECLFIFLFVGCLMRRLIYRLADHLATERTRRNTMSSGGAVLAATTGSPKNILINNIASNAANIKQNNLAVTANGKALPAMEANGGVGDKMPPAVSDNNNGTHANNNNIENSKSNGHTMQNGDGGGNDCRNNGADTVDKACPAALHLTDVGDTKLNEGGDEKTTITKKCKLLDNDLNASLTVPAEGGDVSRSDSRTSCNSLNGSSGGGHGQDIDDCGSALEGLTTSAVGVTTAAAGGGNSDTLKKKLRMSSGRQQTKKAKRVRFFRNGDKFYPGLVIPVSNERYRSFESLTEDLTRVLGESIKVPGAVRTIFTVEGKKVASLDDLEDGKCYVCSCNNELFKRLEYSPNNKLNNRLSR